MSSRFFGLVLPFIFYTVLLLCSVYLFETGVYSDEIMETGYPNGSFEVLLVYFFISLFIFACFWVTIPEDTRKSDLQIFNSSYIFITYSLGLIYFFTPVLMYGPAFAIGLNRYEYMALPHVASFNIKLFLAIYSLALGAILHKGSKKEKRLSTILYAILFFINFCYGEKGSGYIEALLYFTVGYLVASNRKVSLLKATLLLSGICTTIIGFYYLQLSLQGIETTGIIDHFSNRIARQGQVWWKSYDLISTATGPERIKEWSILTEYDAVKNHGQTGGMRWMMSILMPEKAYQNHLGSLAGGYPAIVLHINGMSTFWQLVTLLNILYIIPFFVISILSFQNMTAFILLPGFSYFLSVHLKIFQTGNIYLLANIKYTAIATGMVLFFCLVRRKPHLKV